MTDASPQPSLYQINTRTWLAELSAASSSSLTLADVPDLILDHIAALGIDWVWMMGIWQTGQAGRRIAASIPELRQEFERILPDFIEEDICGSPFAVQGYHVHRDFGGNEALRRFRQRLAQRGMHLLLDFVPNHTAIDHPWATLHPEYYIQGKPADLDRRPGYYIGVQTSLGWRVLAHGRDPYFPPWSDTLQLNYREPALRHAMLAELEHVAGMCDGVRCDMAMLLLPEVILKTWGERPLPSNNNLLAEGSGRDLSGIDDLFWLEAIQQVKQQHAGFMFIAEVYWNLEPRLLELGFDYTYDKVLYDHLRSGSADAVRQHLSANPAYQSRQVRFLENHDEPRAAQSFAGERGPAAAMLCYLAPGLHFFHHGQLEGRRIRVPVQLCRPPLEAGDEALSAFYAALLTLLRREELHQGAWQLLDCQPVSREDPTWRNFVAYCWSHQQGETELIVIVNFSSMASRCSLQPWEGSFGVEPSFVPLLTSQTVGQVHWQSGRLSCELPSWGYQVLEIVQGAGT